MWFQCFDKKTRRKYFPKKNFFNELYKSKCIDPLKVYWLLLLLLPGFIIDPILVCPFLPSLSPLFNQYPINIGRIIFFFIKKKIFNHKKMYFRLPIEFYLRGNFVFVKGKKSMIGIDKRTTTILKDCQEEKSNRNDLVIIWIQILDFVRRRKK